MAACIYFDSSAENYVEVYKARAEDEDKEFNVENDARDAVTQTVRDAYSHFIKEWWPKEQARLAALNKDNPGIEMDI